jgi:hypothetical protein
MRLRRGIALVVAVLALAGGACGDKTAAGNPTPFEITGTVQNTDPRARATQDPTNSEITGLIILREDTSSGFEECTADVTGVGIFVKKQTTFSPKEIADLIRLRGVTVRVKGKLTKGDRDICTPIADSLVMPDAKAQKKTKATPEGSTEPEG